MTRDIFPGRIETDRLVFERVSHDTVDPFALYEFVTREGWQQTANDAPDPGSFSRPSTGATSTRVNERPSSSK